MSTYLRHASRLALLTVAVMVAALFGFAGAIPARAADGPSFAVDPLADALWGAGWDSDAPITVKLDGKKGAVIGTARTDYVGAFRTDLTYDVKAGTVLLVSDGTASVTHTVTTLKVRSVDTTADTVTGTALKLSTVEVGIVGGPSSIVSVSKTGTWSADGLGLAYGMRGYAAQTVGSASTWIPWETHNPVFRVEPADEGYWVWGTGAGDRLSVGYEWPASTDLTVVVQSTDGTVLETRTVTTDEFGDFNNWGGTPIGGRSHPGDIVTVTDGTVDPETGVVVAGTDTVTKTHTVTALTLDLPIMYLTDIVTGTAEPGSTVYVQPTLADDPVGRYVTADQDGIWRTDFSVTSPSGEPAFDLVAMSMGYAAQQDDDGDATHIGWHVDVPNFTAHPDTDTITGFHWSDKSTWQWYDDVSVIVEGDAAGPRTVPIDGPEASFRLDLGTYDLKPGDVVRVTDGTVDDNGDIVGATVIKEHTVASLTMSADLAGNTVSGTARMGDGTVAARIGVQASGIDGWGAREDTPVDQGPKTSLATWSVTFTGAEVDEWGNVQPDLDLRPFTGVTASVLDDDFDSTEIGTLPAVLVVDTSSNQVWGMNWQKPRVNAAQEVNVSVDGTLAATATTDDNGYFAAEFSEPLAPGEVVTVTDGVTTKEHTVMPLHVSGVDLDTDTVTGEAATEHGPIYLAVSGADGQPSAATLEVPPATAWTGSFTGIHDIAEGSHGFAAQIDPDGDVTWAGWSIELPPPPIIFIDPFSDTIWGYQWTPPTTEAASVEILLDDAPIATAPLDENGEFSTVIEPGLSAGQTVTVTDGVMTKTHTLTSLTVTAVDPNTDIVTGTADAGPVIVGVYDTEGQSAAQVEISGPQWTADLSALYDIVTETVGYAGQFDEDGDATWMDWRGGSEPRPQATFRVEPVIEVVWGFDWTPGAEVQVRVNGASVGTFLPDENGEFRAEVAASVDLVAGDTVTVSDETQTKEHTLTSLLITAIDPVTDTMTGFADADLPAVVGIYDAEGQSATEVSVEGPEWTAAFPEHDITAGTRVYAGQFDEDGDATWIDWMVPDDPSPSPRFYVGTALERVWGDGWTAEAGEVEIRVDTSFTTTAPLDEQGRFLLEHVDFDLAAGQTVTVTDGQLEKVLTLSPLAIASIDPATDTVTGVADETMPLLVGIVGADGQSLASIEIEGAPEWTASLSTVYDIVSGTTCFAAQFDQDGDGTFTSQTAPTEPEPVP